MAQFIVLSRRKIWHSTQSAFSDTGAIGRRLIPQLIAAGYDVTGTTRSEHKLNELRAAGADALVVDGLVRDDVHTAVTRAQPDVVIHQLTALGKLSSFKKVRPGV